MGDGYLANRWVIYIEKEIAETSSGKYAKKKIPLKLLWLVKMTHLDIWTHKFVKYIFKYLAGGNQFSLIHVRISESILINTYENSNTYLVV